MGTAYLISALHICNIYQNTPHKIILRQCYLNKTLTVQIKIQNTYTGYAK